MKIREKQAIALANKLGMRMESKIGSGQNGTAFETECGRVIKITKDVGEFCHADNLRGKEFEHFANVYETFVFPDGHFGIVMEKLEICDELSHQFSVLREMSESLGVDYLELELEEHPDYEVLQDLIDDIALIYSEDHKHKLLSSDLHEDNVGLKSCGTVAVFDMRHDEIIMNNVVNAEKVIDRVRARQKRQEQLKTPTL